MSDNVNQPDGNTDAPRDEYVPKSKFEEAVATRQKAKDKAGKLEEERDALQAQLNAILSEQAAAKAEAEEAKKRAEGRFDELLAEKSTEFQSQLSEKDQALQAALAQVETFQRNDRMGKFQSAIASKVDVDPAILRGLLREAEASHGMDIAPDNFSDDTVADAIKRLRGMSEAAFQTKPMGVKPGSANQSTQLSDLERAVNALNAFKPSRSIQSLLGK